MKLFRFDKIWAEEGRLSKAVMQLGYIIAAELQHGEMQSIAYQRDQFKTSYIYKKS